MLFCENTPIAMTRAIKYNKTDSENADYAGTVLATTPCTRNVPIMIKNLKNNKEVCYTTSLYCFPIVLFSFTPFIRFRPPFRKFKDLRH